VTARRRVISSVPIAVGTDAVARDLARADVEVAGLEHAGSSFELRIFLNNPNADERTEPTDDSGYAGSIYVYGYGLEPDATDARPPPMTRSTIATDAVRRARQDAPTASVTLVAVPSDSTDPPVGLDGLSVSVLVDERPAGG